MSLGKVIACVKNNKNFLITSHTNPEGDALGSELAFYRLLKTSGKNATIVNDDKLPYGYEFLPDVKNIKRLKKDLKNIRFDCLVFLDCSDLERAGGVYKINKDAKPTVNIDHHISNTRFGSINWVEPEACSSCEMVYKLYNKLHIPIDKKTALLLYVGILTDTGSFHYPNTTHLTHRIAADLLSHKLSIKDIYKNIYENIPFEDMKLLSKILPAMRKAYKGKIIWFEIKKELLENRKLSFDLTENILSFARAIKGAEVAVLFKENIGVKNEIRVNLRSQGKVDVNKIASFFGGGGHKTASGATVKGKIDQVKKKILRKIKDNLK